MGPTYNGIPASQIRNAAWRKSRASNPSGNCVELARLEPGVIAIRNSRDPDGPALVYARAEIEEFLKGIKDGDFDGLVA